MRQVVEARRSCRITRTGDRNDTRPDASREIVVGELGIGLEAIEQMSRCDGGDETRGVE